MANITEEKAAYGYGLYIRYNGDLKAVSALVNHRISARLAKHYADLKAEGYREYVPMNKHTYNLA